MHWHERPPSRREGRSELECREENPPRFAGQAAEQVTGVDHRVQDTRAGTLTQAPVAPVALVSSSQ